jgi:hypothetical protein
MPYPNRAQRRGHHLIFCGLAVCGTLIATSKTAAGNYASEIPPSVCGTLSHIAESHRHWAITSAHHTIPLPAELADKVATSDLEKGTGDVLYRDLDVDGDGRTDAVKQQCGSGVDRLCTLSVTFSSGGTYTSPDLAPFYIALLDRRIFLINDGLTWRGNDGVSKNPTFLLLKNRTLQAVAGCTPAAP